MSEYPWLYQAADETARERSKQAASTAMAPDFYTHGPKVGDAVSDVWEPLIRQAYDALIVAVDFVMDDDKHEELCRVAARVREAIGGGA